MEAVAFGVPVHAISNRTGDGLDRSAPTSRPGRTAALLGSSGVGKSTLVNTLAGKELLATQEIREDGGAGTRRGRELVQLPGGGLVVDTPGMPSSSSGVVGRAREAFEDVRRSRPNAASRTAPTRASRLRGPGRAGGRDADSARWESYIKLQRELEHLERKLDKRLRPRRERGGSSSALRDASTCA